MKSSVVVPIFNNEYQVIVAWGDLKKARQLMKSWGYEKLAEQSDLDSRRGVCFYADTCHPVIVLPRFPTTPSEIGTLAHEAHHAINNIFDKLQADKNNDEVFAHSIGAVVRTVLNAKRNGSRK